MVTAHLHVVPGSAASWLLPASPLELGSSQDPAEEENAAAGIDAAVVVLPVAVWHPQGPF